MNNTNRKQFAILLCIAFIFFSHKLSAQNTSDKKGLISQTLESFYNNYHNQKIILQTDKPLYITEERLWFKAFVLNSYTQKIDLTSKNLFVDLVGDNDSVIAKLVLDNEHLRTDGAIILPDTLNTGFYWLRAYTAAMLNNPEYIFIQPVYVLNKSLHDENIYNNRYKGRYFNNSTTPVIQFFPERLTNIPGIISTGVIKITDARHDPLTISGNIINDHDSVAATFTTNRFGLSCISFLNDINSKYTAVINVNGKIIKYELPAVDHNAAQLSITNQTEKNVKAFVTLEDSLPPNFQTIILGLHADSLCYAAVGNGTYGTKISLEKFPGGISSLLLFDEHENLLDERMIYIDKENYKAEIKPDKANYATRENVILDIKVTDEDREPLAASLNISVQDAWIAELSDSLEADDSAPTDKFFLDNWLNKNHNNLSATDIDLLMVSAKSFKQKPKFNNNNEDAPQYDDNSKLLNLNGTITDKKDMPAKDRILTVMSNNMNSFFIDADTTKADGSFTIPLPQNTDSLSLSVQVKDKHDATRNDDNIGIDSFTFPRLSTPSFLKEQFLHYDLDVIAAIKKYHIDTAITFQGKGWLTPITVKTIKKEELNYDASRRINSMSQILTSDKFRYGGYNAIGNAILTVPGVSLFQSEITVFGPGVNTGGITRPLLIVDGYAVRTDNVLNYLNELNAADIDFIEVLRGGEAAYYGSRGGAGVISINTRHSPKQTNYSNNNLHIISPLTYHVCPKFEMPDYSIPETRNNKIPDPRTTIYWNGNIITDAKGQAIINFYTADHKTNYAVTISGLTAKGYFIYKRIWINKN